MAKRKKSQTTKRALAQRIQAVERKLAAQEAERAPTQAEKRAAYDGMVLGLRAKLAARLAELGIVVKEPEVFEKGPQVEKVVVARKKIPHLEKAREPDTLAVGFSSANGPEPTYGGYGDLRGSSEAEIWRESARRYGPPDD